jgi:hypothetical protein
LEGSGFVGGGGQLTKYRAALDRHMSLNTIGVIFAICQLLATTDEGRLLHGATASTMSVAWIATRSSRLTTWKQIPLPRKMMSITELDGRGVAGTPAIC